MPNPTQTSFNRLVGAAVVAQTTLDNTDNFVYQPSGRQVLILSNPTGSTITCKLIGNETPSALEVPRVGAINLTSGLPVEVPAGASVAIALDTVAQWIKGTRSSIIDGTGLICQLYTYETLPTVPDLLWIDAGKLVFNGVLTQSSKLWG